MTNTLKITALPIWFEATYYVRCVYLVCKYRQPLSNQTWGQTIAAILTRQCRPHWLRKAI